MPILQCYNEKEAMHAGSCKRPGMLVLVYSYLLGLCAEGITNSMTHRETAKAAVSLMLVAIFILQVLLDKRPSGLVMLVFSSSDLLGDKRPLP